MTLGTVEWALGWAGAVAVTLALADTLLGVWRGLRRPKGRATDRARGAVRAPLLLLLGSMLYLGLCAVLWRPLPSMLSLPTRVAGLTLGTLLFFPGVALILWGRLVLGKMYNVSSIFGVQLFADHRLVTHGPFAFVRHPMYLGLLATALGGLLIYRTWTFVLVAAQFVALVVRARREEQVLAAEFGAQWEEYSRRTPAWIPHLGRGAK